MKNLLYISEQEKKNIMKMHGILNEQERKYDGSTWGYYLDDSGEKKHYDDKGMRIHSFETLIGKKIVPSKNRATIEVWSSGCDYQEKVCRNITKHKIEITQEWRSEENKFNIYHNFYYSTGESSYLQDVDSRLLTFVDPPLLKIKTSDTPKFPFNIFGSEADAKSWRDEKIAQGYKDLGNTPETKNVNPTLPRKEEVNKKYIDNGKEDKYYRYLEKNGNWFARNKTKNGPVFNLSKKAENNPAIKNSIDNLKAASSGEKGKELVDDSSK